MAGVAAMLAGRMKKKKSPIGAVDDEQEADVDGETEADSIVGAPPGRDPEDSAEEADGVEEGPDTMGDEMSDYDAIESSAVADMMATKDPEVFKAALRDFVRACMDRGDE